MGNCTSFPKDMMKGEEGGAAPLPEQPKEETAAPQVQEVEKMVETKEDDMVVEDKTVDEGEKKPESTDASLEEAASSTTVDKKDSSEAGETPEVEEKKELVASEAAPEVAPPSTGEKPEEVAETPVVVVAEVAKEETK